MKTKNLFLWLILPVLVLAIIGCKKDNSSSSSSSNPKTPSVSVESVTFHDMADTLFVTINLGKYEYYGVDVDDDGSGWCTAEVFLDKAKGKVQIITKQNIAFEKRSCHVNCWVSHIEYPEEEDKVMLPILIEQEAAIPNGTYQGHEWINLGLPSGTLWATCNVGAETPEEWGYCYKWAEVAPSASSTNNWEHYKYCMGAQGTLTKYNQGESSGYMGFTDDLTELEPMDDAATVNWGDGWCMPTLAQIRELSTYTYWSWETTPNGVKGNRYTSKTNGNSIFIPADADGHYATIWTKSLYAGINAWKFTQGGDTYGIDWDWRCFGKRVRPVRK